MDVPQAFVTLFSMLLVRAVLIQQTANGNSAIVCVKILK